MKYADFLGLGALPSRLEAEFSGGMSVNAYLFVGPSGTGKMQMATICARALNCAGAQKPCDACPPCLRGLAGTHPDVITIEPDGKKSGVGVDEIRELIGRVMIKPFEGGMHAVIIRDADQMTSGAQNALLKTLESGPESCVFFLLATSAARLLSTILSRCRIVRFHAIDEALCAQVLEAREIEPIRAALLSRAAMGCVGKALALHEDEEYWPLRSRVIEALEALSSSSGGMSVALGLLKDEKDRAGDVLEIVESIGRELMLTAEGGKPSEALRRIKIDGATLLGAALSAKERAASNVVWINVIEHLFLQVGR